MEQRFSVVRYMVQLMLGTNIEGTSTEREPAERGRLSQNS